MSAVFLRQSISVTILKFFLPVFAACLQLRQIMVFTLVMFYLYLE